MSLQYWGKGIVIEAPVQYLLTPALTCRARSLRGLRPTNAPALSRDPLGVETRGLGYLQLPKTLVEGYLELLYTTLQWNLLQWFW